MEVLLEEGEGFIGGEGDSGGEGVVGGVFVSEACGWGGGRGRSERVLVEDNI